MEQKQTTPGELAALILIGAFIFVFSILTYFHLGEDAFISYRYSMNLAEGRGLVYNAGEHVEGYSNLLWVLAMVPFHWLDIRMHVAARLVSTILFVVLMVGAWCGARRVASVNTPRWVALWLAAALALDPLLHFHSDQGLETLPYAVLLGLTLFIGATGGSVWWAGALGALAALTRPEGIGFVLALAPAVVAAHARGGRLFPLRPSSIRPATLFLVLPVAAFMVQLLFRKMTYGEWVPNTVIAKRAGGTGGLEQLIAFTASRAFLPVLAVVGLLWGLRVPRLRPLAIAGICMLAAAALFQLRAGGLLNIGFRYLAPAFVPVLLGMWMLVTIMEAFLRENLRPGTGRNLFIGFMAVVLILPVPVLLYSDGAMGRWMRGNTDAPRSRFHLRLFEPSTYNVRERLNWFFSDPVFINAEVGRWISENLPAESLLAADQMGQLGFYAGPERSIIDLLGLMDAHVARHGLTWEYLVTRRPDYMIVDSCLDTQFWPRNWRGKPHVPLLRDFFEREEVQTTYRPRWLLRSRLPYAQNGFMVYVHIDTYDGAPMEEVYVGVDQETFEDLWRIP